jgi:hypothetical protein
LDGFNLSFQRVRSVTAGIVAVPLLTEFIKALLLLRGVYRIGFVGLNKLFTVFSVVPDAGCTSTTPLPALTLPDVQGDTLQFFLHQTLNQHAVSRAIALIQAEQIFTDIATCRLVGLAPINRNFTLSVRISVSVMARLMRCAGVFAQLAFTVSFVP